MEISTRRLARGSAARPVRDLQATDHRTRCGDVRYQCGRNCTACRARSSAIPFAYGGSGRYRRHLLYRGRPCPSRLSHQFPGPPHPDRLSQRYTIIDILLLYQGVFSFMAFFWFFPLFLFLDLFFLDFDIFSISSFLIRNYKMNSITNKVLPKGSTHVCTEIIDYTLSTAKY